MKKVFVILVGFIFIVGFNKYRNIEIPKSKSNNQDCKKLSEYNLLTDNTEKAKWLKDNSGNICPSENLEEAVYKTHLISKDDFGKWVVGKTKTTFSWKNDIEPLLNQIDGYKKYISFEFDNKGKILKLITINDYRENPSCYSKECFNSIKNNAIKLGSKDEDVFFSFYSDQNKHVIFQVEDLNIINSHTISEHNISNEPFHVIKELKKTKDLKKNEKFIKQGIEKNNKATSKNSN